MHYQEQYTLAELADAAAMTERNVRAYAGRGLQPPAGRSGRRSVYGPQHVARLRLVHSLHEHGLTLRVIADLVRRGTADAELARLGREELDGVHGADRVPLAAPLVEQFEQERPGGMQALVDAGVVVRDGDRYLAGASGLGVVSALDAHGAGLEVSAEIALLAAAAADRCAPELERLLKDCPEDDDAERVDLAVQLAATCFAEALTARLPQH